MAFIVKGTNIIGAGSSSSSDYHEYSTTEKVIGKWIDGKPVYEKVWVIPYSTSVSAGQNTINLSDVNSIDTIVDFSAILDCGDISIQSRVDTANLTSGSSYVVGYNTFSVNYINKSQPQLIFMIGLSWINAGVYQWKKIIYKMQYTKTTDAPASIL